MIVAYLRQSGVLYDDEIEMWLRARNELLGHARPDALLQQGQFSRVLAAATVVVWGLSAISAGGELRAHRDATLPTPEQMLEVWSRR